MNLIPKKKKLENMGGEVLSSSGSDPNQDPKSSFKPNKPDLGIKPSFKNTILNGFSKWDTKGQNIRNHVENYDGILIPSGYRNQVYYRECLFYRLSLPLLLLIIFSLVICGVIYGWGIIVQKRILEMNRLVLIQKDKIKNVSNAIQPTRDKYLDLKKITHHIRIPVSPVLDSIEKTIPKELSLTRINLVCLPNVEKRDEQKRSFVPERRVDLSLSLFFFEKNLPKSEREMGSFFKQWETQLKEKLLQNGLELSGFDLGKPRKYSGIFNPSSSQEENVSAGYSIDLKLLVQFRK